MPSFFDIGDVVAAVEHAGTRLANLEQVFTYRLKVVHAVEAGHFCIPRSVDLQQPSHIVHHRHIQPSAKLFPEPGVICPARRFYVCPADSATSFHAPFDTVFENCGIINLLINIFAGIRWTVCLYYQTPRKGSRTVSCRNTTDTVDPLANHRPCFRIPLHMVLHMVDDPEVLHPSADLRFLRIHLFQERVGKPGENCFKVIISKQPYHPYPSVPSQRAH